MKLKMGDEIRIFSLAEIEGVAESNITIEGNVKDLECTLTLMA